MLRWRTNSGRHPPQHWHFKLLLRRDCVGHAVQVQPALAERFAVIRYVHHCNVVSIALLLQKRDHACENVIGIAQRVVVRIDNLLLSTLMQRVGLARRLEAPELGGITSVVGGAVIPELMKDDEQVGAWLASQRIHSVQQDFIEAMARST